MVAQLVFLHGPEAGGCSAAYFYQLRRFPGALAPDLPGHPEGAPLDDVPAYARWLQGWLRAQGGGGGHLALAGFTLGACIALQYALDYPDEVAGLLLMTAAMRPKERAPGSLESRRRAAADPQAFQEWLDEMERIMQLIDPRLRRDLLECHRRVGPLTQLHDLQVIDQFDVRHRIAGLRAPTTLVRGLDDPLAPEQYELEIHQAVPNSRYVELAQAGHFPMAEQPEAVNRLIEELLQEIDRYGGG